jgi:very-short-patch-repair endonuclease
MMRAAQMAARWWNVPPRGQVSYLVGADPQLLRIALDPLPDSAPAVIQFRPGTGGPTGDQVALLLDEMDLAAVALFPRWLPGAERLDGSRSLGVPAVRELAARVAARSHNFGPFLADLAERALCGRTGRPRFPAEVRGRGLARVIADAYDRESVALLIEVPDELSPAEERALVAAAEWLAQHGHLTVWLAGAPLRAVDRLPAVAITLPAHLAQLVAEAGPATDGDAAGDANPGERPSATDGGHQPANTGPVFRYPPLSGVPRQDSAAELRLERALAPHEWARGRRWNHTYEWHLLGKPYRLDLFWPTEGIVVEVDGPDHRERLKFADDRRRDVQLHLRGHVVLRFTNEQVLADVETVVRKIEQLLSQRRETNTHYTEMGRHVDD